MNTSNHDATMAYLELVREQYGIAADRNDVVCRALEAAADGVEFWRPIDSFTTAPAAIVTHIDLSTHDGDSFTALVNASRNREAEQLLVRTAYRCLASRGGPYTEL